MNISIRNEYKYIVIFFLIISVLFLYNKQNIIISSESDGYFHALGAYFIYDFIKWWISNPTISFKSIEIFVFNYELQYKFFGGISHYQPFQSFFAAFIMFLSGKSHISFYISTIIETLITLFFAKRTYELLYGKARYFPFLVMFFIAFNPAVFNFSASFSLELGVMMFSTITVYYFIRFLRNENPIHLLLSMTALGFALLTKTSAVIIFPILLVSVIIERKINIFIRNYRYVVLSLIILIVVISPWIIMEIVFSSMGISKIGERISAGSINLDVPILARIENINLTIFYVFGSFLLIPFFIYKIINSKMKKGEFSIIIFIALYLLFYNILPNVQSRYLTAVVPFLMIFVVRGIEIFHIKYKENVFTVLIVVVMLSSILTTIHYTTNEKIFHSSTDMYSAAVYISDNTIEKTTVMSTFSRMQSVPFNIINDENIAIVRAPFNNEGGKEELKTMLDSSDYIKRPHRPEWKKFNLSHSPIGWVVIHERYDGLEPDYKLKDVIDKRLDFVLDKIIYGSWPGNSIHIYKRRF